MRFVRNLASGIVFDVPDDHFSVNRPGEYELLPQPAREVPPLEKPGGQAKGKARPPRA